MYLTDISNLPTFSVFRAAKKPEKLDAVSRLFDEALLRRIKALGPPPPSISLSWLSRAFDLLSFAHNEAKSLISDLKSDDDSLARYLDHSSVKILDLCNSVSSQIEKLRHGGLLVNFFLHLVSSPEPEKLQRARNNLAVAFQISNPAPILIGGAIRRKFSTVGRLIHAVELIAAFVGAAVASTGIGPVRAPAEYSWAGPFNDLWAELERSAGACFEEWADVEARVGEVCDAIDDVGRGERLNGAVAELEKARVKLTEGLDGVADGVNGTFRAVLCVRNGMLANFRLGQDEKRPPKATKRCA